MDDLLFHNTDFQDVEDDSYKPSHFHGKGVTVGSIPSNESSSCSIDMGIPIRPFLFIRQQIYDLTIIRLLCMHVM